MERDVTYRFPENQIPVILASTLELVAELADTDAMLCTDAVWSSYNDLRSLLDEHVEVIDPDAEPEFTGTELVGPS